jgi:hypothetical protein
VLSVRAARTAGVVALGSLLEQRVKLELARIVEAVDRLPLGRNSVLEPLLAAAPPHHIVRSKMYGPVCVCVRAHLEGSRCACVGTHAEADRRGRGAREEAARCSRGHDEAVNVAAMAMVAAALVLVADGVAAALPGASVLASLPASHPLHRTARLGCCGMLLLERGDDTPVCLRQLLAGLAPHDHDVAGAAARLKQRYEHQNARLPAPVRTGAFSWERSLRAQVPPAAGGTAVERSGRTGTRRWPRLDDRHTGRVQVKALVGRRRRCKTGCQD